MFLMLTVHVTYFHCISHKSSVFNQGAGETQLNVLSTGSTHRKPKLDLQYHIRSLEQGWKNST